jgi:hypothetical protein
MKNPPVLTPSLPNRFIPTSKGENIENKVTLGPTNPSNFTKPQPKGNPDPFTKKNYPSINKGPREKLQGLCHMKQYQNLNAEPNSARD